MIQKKTQRPLHRRILMTMIALTAGILLVVALMFNLFIRFYVTNRVNIQMRNMVTQLASNPPVGPMENEPPGPPISLEAPPNGFGGLGDHEDRVLGTRGTAIVFNADGSIRRSVGEENAEIAERLSMHFRQNGGLKASGRTQMLSLTGGTYVVSVDTDPVQPDAFLVFCVDVTSITAFTTMVNVLLFVIVLAAILLSVLLSRHFAKTIAEPVQSLSAFAADIGNGDFRQRELHFRDAEFNALSDSMNRMAAELLEANEKQETFFQNVSHEFRTPLTAIRGNAEGILFGVMDPENSSKVILSETDRLSGFVEDLLYISRVGKGVVKEEWQEIDLREVLSLCVSEQHAESKRRNVAFSFDFDEEPVLLPMREQDAHHLFSNLISNAIRYAEAKVTLSCHGGSQVIVTVADDGPGISGEELPRIFERFYKGKDGKHGIGLSIVKSVVDAYGGTIAVTGAPGAVFTVRFEPETAEKEAE